MFPRAPASREGEREPPRYVCRVNHFVLFLRAAAFSILFIYSISFWHGVVLSIDRIECAEPQSAHDIIEVLNFKLQFICFKRPCARDCFSVHQLCARPWWLYISPKHVERRLVVPVGFFVLSVVRVERPRWLGRTNMRLWRVNAKKEPFFSFSSSSIVDRLHRLKNVEQKYTNFIYLFLAFLVAARSLHYFRLSRSVQRAPPHNIGSPHALLNYGSFFFHAHFIKCSHGSASCIDARTYSGFLRFWKSTIKIYEL